MTLCGIEAWTVFLIDEQHGTKLAQKVNWISGATLASLYVLLNIALLIPGIRHKSRELEKYRSKAASTTTHVEQRNGRKIQPAIDSSSANKQAEQGVTEWHVDLTSPPAPL